MKHSEQNVLPKATGMKARSTQAPAVETIYKKVSNFVGLGGGGEGWSHYIVVLGLTFRPHEVANLWGQPLQILFNFIFQKERKKERNYYYCV